MATGWLKVRVEYDPGLTDMDEIHDVLSDACILTADTHVGVEDLTFFVEEGSDVDDGAEAGT